VANALGNGPIQCRAIHAGSATGNDFEWRLANDGDNIEKVRESLALK